MKIMATILTLCTATALAQLPPMPPKAYKPAKTEKGAEALVAPKAVVLPPKTSIQITWDCERSNVTYNVYHSFEPLAKMRLLTNVAIKTFTKKMDERAEFFDVKAVTKGNQ